MALRLFRSSSSIPGQWSQLLQNASIAPHAFLRPAISLQIPGILSDIWESVLRAVPKKKTSHMKKRHRQMAGKALKDVKNLNTCSGCGQIKRAHTLCPHCVESMQTYGVQSLVAMFRPLTIISSTGIKKQWGKTQTA